MMLHEGDRESGAGRQASTDSGSGKGFRIQQAGCSGCKAPTRKKNTDNLATDCGKRACICSDRVTGESQVSRRMWESGDQD